MNQKIIYAGLLVFAASASISMSAQVLGALLILAGWIYGMAERKKIFDKGIGLREASLVLLLLVLLVSTLFSVNVSNSIRRLTGFIGEACLYFAVISFAWNKKRLSDFVRIMVIFALLESVYGVMQYFTGISFLNYSDSKKEIAAFGRVFGTWDHFNSLGGILGMIIPVGVFAGIYSENKRKKTFYLASSAVMIACLVLTFTRGAWIGVFLALVILGIIENKKIITIALALVIILLAFPVSRTRIIKTFNINKESDRIEMWKSAVSSVKHSPLLGNGLETFRDVFYSTVDEKEKADFHKQNFFHYHNTYLGLAAETGLIGLALFVIFSLGIIVEGIKKIRVVSDRYLKGIMLGFLGTILCFLAHGFVDYNLRGNTVYLFWISCALVVYISSKDSLELSV